MPRMTITLMLFFFINLITMSGYAATKAGTKIINQAHATYFDTGSGEIFKILSNYAIFHVAPKLDVDQNRDQQIKAAAGQPTYFPHTIVNTGNQPDQYDLSVANISNDNGDLQNLRVFIDENGDGLVNFGEPEITSTHQLQPGQQMQIVVSGTVPNSSTEGDQYNITVTTTSKTDPTVKDTNNDIVTTSTGPIVRINRTTDMDCSIPMGIGDRSQHIVKFTNLGNQSPQERNVLVDGAQLRGVLIQEDIPDHMSLLKAPPFYSTPVDGILLVGTPLGEWLSYEQWNSSLNANGSAARSQRTVINKLAVLMPADKMKPGQSGKFGYTYQVVSLPTDETSLEIQTTVDADNDGNADFHSNSSCNTVEADNEIIKERPDLVLTGTVFDSGNLTGIGGADVVLMDATTNTPVATTLSADSGYYEFAGVPAGQYYIKVTPPQGYELSAHEPDYFTTFTVTDPSYGQAGFGLSSDTNTKDEDGVIGLDPAKVALLVDIPLDREGIRGQIAITKTTSTNTANLGEPVAYTIAINNLTEQDLYNAHIEDLLPRGFKYLSDTAKIDGAYTADPKITYNSATGRSKMEFRLGDFAVGSTHELTYIAQVTALATHSDGINTAFAYGDTITDLLVKSPTATAQVDVGLTGVLSDRAIIFGRIAVAKGCPIGPDKAVNDSGFPLAGVRLYMEDGTYVVTDPNGQYSLYGLQPGMHVLKIDDHSLPEGVQLTLTDSEQAGDPDSRFVDLTPGDFHRADFTAACPETPRPQVVTQCIEQAPPPVIVKRPEPIKTPQPVVKKPVRKAVPIVRPSLPPVVRPTPVPTPTPTPPVRKVRQCVDHPVTKKSTKMVTRSIKDVIKPIYFASGKADIPMEYVTKLRQLMYMARDKQNVRFRMLGHTDNQRLKPSTKRKFATNQGLSEARATKIAQYVLKRLGSKIRISVTGFGDARPAASNATPEGMAQNRRVELVMQYDEPEVTIHRSSKQVCTLETVAPNSKLVRAMKTLDSGNLGNKGMEDSKLLQAIQALNSGSLAKRGVKTSTSIRNRKVKRRSGVKPARAAKNMMTLTTPTVSSTAMPAGNLASTTAINGQAPLTISQNKQLTGLAPQQPQPSQQNIVRRGKKICTTKEIPATNPVIQNILARSKQEQSGWRTEVETLDLSNANSLKNVAQLAGEDGDISSGLIEAYNQQIKQQQYDFARTQAVESAAAERQEQISMPDPKIAVKTITNEQGKTGTWLWPKGDTSLDGRFMAIVRSGVSPTLVVNGKAVSNSHLGEQIENRKAKAQVMAWYGVELQEGENTLKITAKGPFGNDRVLAQKVVKRPSSGVVINMRADGSLTADGGRSILPVHIEILDRNGYPAKGTYFLTLENSDGRWAEPDIQDKVPGHQVKVTNGQRTVNLRSSTQSGKIKLRASTGKLQSETDVSQVAELRPLVAVGLIDLRAHKGYRSGYENLGLIQLDESSEDIEVNGRAALFMKGRVRGDMHLTMSYDSEKDKDAELLRDIDPADYYRVYGDSSKRGYEGQSRSPLYLKLEKDRNSVMWGDYLTDNGTQGADIARSQRTLTGLNGIYDNGQTRVQLFAAQQDNMRGFEEIPGNGTAMQYQLQDAPIVKNSEVVEVVTRDRANSGLILATEKLQRFRDYSIDDYTGFMTFHRVIPSLDDNLNPVTLRISYDRIEEGEDYLVAGVRMLHNFTDSLSVGASYTTDEHETEGYQLAGVHAEYEDELTELELGVARMVHNNGDEGGDAIRLQASRKWAPGSRTELLATQADAGYSNNSSGVIANRRELKISHQQQLAKNLDAELELSHSEALGSEELRQSVELSATTKLGDWKLKGGARHIRQTTDNDEERINTAIVGVERSVELFERKGNIKAEYEREIGDAARQRISVGADMQITDKTKAYIRYERADRLSSGTLAGSVDTRNSLVAGVKAQVLPSTEMYSEYRIEGGISGEDVVAANGVKATLNLAENFVITPSIEFLNYFEDSEKSDSIAASVGIRDTRDPDAKKLLRMETRYSDDERFYGLNGTYIQKFSDNTTFLVQDELRFNQYDDEREDALQNTLTLAAAHRPKLDDNYNAIYAYKWEKDDSNNTDTHILSTHQNYKINESWTVSGRIGAKKQILNQGGSSHDSNAVMADARATWDVTDRVNLDIHGGILGTNGFSEYNYSVGAGVNFNVVDNLQIGAGYNFAGFVDEHLDPDGYNAKGMYLGLQFKADEAMFDWLRDDKSRGGGDQWLINRDCEPKNRIEITDADMKEKQRKQIAACQFERQQLQQENQANTGYYGK